MASDTDTATVWSIVAKLDRRGWTQDEIAAHPSVGLSQGRISKILKEIRTKLLDGAKQDTAESAALKQEQRLFRISQLTEVLREAWSSFELSRKCEEQIVEERKLSNLFSEPFVDEKGRTKAHVIGQALQLVKDVKTKRGRLPCDRYLTLIGNTIMDICRLEGLVDGDTINVGFTKVQINWGDMAKPPEDDPIEAAILGVKGPQSTLPPIMPPVEANGKVHHDEEVQ